MTNHRPKHVRGVTCRRTAIGTTAIVIGIVAIVLVAAIDVLVIATQPNISTTIHPSSLSNQSTIPSASATATTLTSNSAASSVSAVCSITAESAGAAVRVLSDSGSPIAGEQFSGANINPCGNSTISPIATDSSGWIALPGTLGTYNLTLSYQGRGYNVNVPMYPVTLTEVTLRVPSGVFSVDVVPYGAHPVFSGPSFASASGGLQLNVTLGNSTVQAGSYLPIRVAFVGRGAWNASYADVSMVVTNSAGVNVLNITQKMPDLYSIPYTNQLQGFTSYLGWNARNQTNTVPIVPGEYTLVFGANVDGQLLRVQGTVRVVQ